jgi:1-aminocyclopropane-1-carboxylate deaminase
MPADPALRPGAGWTEPGSAAEDYCRGARYSETGPTTLDAMRLAARTEGMVTDPVYEGKSMAALIDLVGRQEIRPDATVLYAHLGGQPAINAYSALF